MNDFTSKCQHCSDGQLFNIYTLTWLSIVLTLILSLFLVSLTVALYMYIYVTLLSDRLVLHLAFPLQSSNVSFILLSFNSRFRTCFYFHDEIPSGYNNWNDKGFRSIRTIPTLPSHWSQCHIIQIYERFYVSSWLRLLLQPLVTLVTIR